MNEVMGTILCQVFTSNLGWTCFFLGQVATNFALMLACYKIKDVSKNIAIINMAHIASPFEGRHRNCTSDKIHGNRFTSCGQAPSTQLIVSHVQGSSVQFWAKKEGADKRRKKAGPASADGFEKPQDLGRVA